MRTVCALVHLLSANLLVKQSLRLGIFKTKTPTFPSTTNSPACVGPNIHGGAEALRVDWVDVELPLSGLIYFVPKGTL
jgi:hypothetical protein